MNKKYIIKKTQDIQKIIKKGIKKHSKNFVIYKTINLLNYNRYCVAVGKKLGNAVKRNKIKRIIKDILMKNTINSNTDYVIIIKCDVQSLSYDEIKKELIQIIKGD